MTAGALGQPKTFEWWMLSMFAIGISYSAFVSLLIPRSGSAGTTTRPAPMKTTRACRGVPGRSAEVGFDRQQVEAVSDQDALPSTDSSGDGD